MADIQGDLVRPVAIIGVAGRYPGDATDPGKLWDLISQGKSAMTEIPSDRFNIDGFYHPHGDRQGTVNFRGGHFMKRNPAAFDAPFFSITPNEAKAMDPQQRMCLEVAFEALENAGVRMEDIAGSETACFVGCFSQDYLNMVLRDPENFPKYNACGTAQSYLSNRLSWFYDLRGPSVTVDTACSSSLVALHLACQSIRTGESEQAIVGGVNFMTTPEMNFPMTFLHMLSADSKCQSFDEKANGYSRGEGAAFVVVKDLEAAIRDNDMIRAVIRNTASNQDGNTPGITLPSAQSQEAMTRKAYRIAGLDLADTGYFEAHGTGTAAGDPIETSALAAAFGKSRTPGDPLYVGSIKSNIGHLEGASGIAGLTKAIHILERAFIPPQVWLDNVNPRIPLEAWNLAIPRKLMPWPKPGLRRISVNSFGFGGSNAHCIIDDAYHYLNTRNLQAVHNTVGPADIGSPGFSTTSSDRDSGISLKSPDDLADQLPKSVDLNLEYHLIRSKLKTETMKLCVWSAHEQSGIDRIGDSFQAYMAKRLQESTLSESNLLKDFSYTLAERRSTLPWKTFAIAGNVQELLDQVKNPPLKPKRSTAPPKLAFVFTGQGAQHFSMGRELLAYDTFATSLEAADRYLTSIGCSWSLLSELCQGESTSRINEPRFSQPLCTAIQIAMIDLLKEWNVTSVGVVGHSSGEIAAAYAAGALTQEDAWCISYERGRLSSMIKSLAPNLQGAMLAAGIGEADALKYLEKVTTGKAVVACINSPSSVTISGDLQAVREIEGFLKTESVFARMLKVETAYHSFHMNTIADLYKDALAHIRPLPAVPGSPKMFSSVTGRQIEHESLGADYWVSNMVNAVRFSQATKALIQSNESGSSKRRTNNKVFADTFLELGPSGALQGPLKQIISDTKLKASCLSLLQRGKSCITSSVDVMGRLWQAGLPIKVGSINNPHKSDHSATRMLVDLPPFPWNHTHTFWHDTPLAHNYRFRKHNRNDLLGLQALEGNMLEPRWRNFLRVSEKPWMDDHVIQGTMLYPAAGMLAMAIEAASQLAQDGSKQIKGFELRDVQIENALVVPRTDEGVETMFQLRPDSGSSHDISEWQVFTLYSRQGHQEWVRHCTGSVKAVADKESGGASIEDEQIRSNQVYRQTYQNFKRSSGRLENPANFYEKCSEVGLGWGDAFQNLKSIQRGEFQCVGTITIPDTGSIMPANFEFPHIVHPCTLDTIVQLILPATLSMNDDFKEAAIPTSIGRLYISSHLPRAAGSSIDAYAHTTKTSQKGSTSSAVVSDKSWFEPLVIFEDFKTTKLGAANDHNATIRTRASLRKLAGDLVWKPDSKYLTQHEFSRTCTATSILKAPASTIRDLETAALIFAKRMVQNLVAEPFEIAAPHLQKFYDFMEHIVEQGQESPSQDDQGISEHEFLARVRGSSIDGAILCRHGENLSSILRGETETLSLLNGENLLHDFEISAIGQSESTEHLLSYIKLLIHRKPNLKILEVGGRSGAATEKILAGIMQGDKSNASLPISSYTFTDLQPRFVDAATEKFAGFAPVINCQRLNIEVDPQEQNFEEGAYDLVFASNFSHAIANLDAAINNVAKLLKPGGAFVVNEVTSRHMRFPMILGSLPAWWMGEHDGRTMTPNINTTQWHERLENNGFTGLNYKFHDWEDPECQAISLMVATTPSAVEFSQQKDAVVIGTPSQFANAQGLSYQLCGELRTRGFHSTTLTLASSISQDLTDKHVVILAELVEPLLYNMNAETFAHVKALLLNTKSTTWITRGAVKESQNPALNLITGLARCARAENPGLSLITVDLDHETDLQDPSNAEVIAKILHETHSATTQAHDDMEYAVRGGSILIPRIMPEVNVNELVMAQQVELEPEAMTLSQPSRSLTLKLGKLGLLGSLHFVDNELHHGPLLSDELEIEVRGVGLSSMDGLIAFDQIDSAENLGFECAGIVSRVGGTDSHFQLGDKVVSWCTNAFSQHVRSKISLIQPMPEDMSFETAASLPVASIAAYASLVDRAGLQKFESVLIHDAAHEVGLASIVLAKHLGATVFATVSNEEEMIFLTREYDIAADHIFDIREMSFADSIKRITSGRGVDVVLNFMPGDVLRQSWSSLADFGRLVNFTTQGLENSTAIVLPRFGKNLSFITMDPTAIFQKDAAKAAILFRKAMKLVARGHCSPIKQIQTFNFSQLDEGLRLLHSRQYTGKIVFTPQATDLVQAIPNLTAEAQFNANSTYLLVGGLGGLGRSLSKWMVDHGARNLAFFSRSGAASRDAKSLLADLEKQGVQAMAYVCDVSKLSDVERAVAACQRDMPPIKGVIQAAMSLADAALYNMTHAQWAQSINPKLGTWNLHLTLPRAMDFFVMLSSCSGIVGTKGQSNYSAGNTFQDALAHHRHSQGLAASAFDVGMVLGVGFVANNADIEEGLKRWGFLGLGEKEFLAILNACITGQSVRGRKMPNQIITGFGTGGWFQSEGDDLPEYLDDARWEHIRNLDVVRADAAGSAAGSGSAAAQLQTQLSRATSAAEALELVQEALVGKLAKWMMILPDDIDGGKPVSNYGVDSLVAVELRTWAFREVQSEISVFDVMSNVPISSLVKKIAAASKIVPVGLVEVE